MASSRLTINIVKSSSSLIVNIVRTRNSLTVNMVRSCNRLIAIIRFSVNIAYVNMFFSATTINSVYVSLFSDLRHSVLCLTTPLIAQRKQRM